MLAAYRPLQSKDQALNSFCKTKMFLVSKHSKMFRRQQPLSMFFKAKWKKIRK